MATFLRLTIAALLIAAASAASRTPPPTAYTNYTVGDKAGWFFNSANTSAFNYSSWAASKTFNLGDFLIFNTNSNQTVIQTFNETTFNSCSIDESDDDDTIQYGGGSTAFGEPLTIPVALTIEGPNYFNVFVIEGIQLHVICNNSTRNN